MGELSLGFYRIDFAAVHDHPIFFSSFPAYKELSAFCTKTKLVFENGKERIRRRDAHIREIKVRKRVVYPAKPVSRSSPSPSQHLMPGKNYERIRDVS